MRAHLLSILDLVIVVVAVCLFRWLTGRDGAPDPAAVAIGLALVALTRIHRLAVKSHTPRERRRSSHPYTTGTGAAAKPPKR